MANKFPSARSAVQDRWAGEITPLTPVAWQSPVIPAASMHSPGSGTNGSMTVPGGMSGAQGGANGSMAGVVPNGGANGSMAGVVPNGAAPQMGSGSQTAGQNGSLDMSTNQPEEVIVAPTTISEAYLTSLKAVLNKNTGNYVVANFLIGTQNMVSWEGILYDVGNDFITIYQEPRERYIVCDIYSLKFIEFFDTRGAAR